MPPCTCSAMRMMQSGTPLERHPHGFPEMSMDGRYQNDPGEGVSEDQVRSQSPRREKQGLGLQNPRDKTDKKDKTDKEDKTDKKEKKAPRERAPPRESPKGKGKDKAKDRPTGWIWTEGLEWVWIPPPKGKGKPGKKGDKGKTKGKEKGRPRSRTSAAERTREAKGGRKGRRRANPPPD